jgi:hypothetical protein
MFVKYDSDAGNPLQEEVLDGAMKNKKIMDVRSERRPMN